MPGAKKEAEPSAPIASLRTIFSPSHARDPASAVLSSLKASGRLERARRGRMEKIFGPKGAYDPNAPSRWDRDMSLFELLVSALALKVIGGGETPERFRELATEGYERLLGHYRSVVGPALFLDIDAGNPGADHAGELVRYRP